MRRIVRTEAVESVDEFLDRGGEIKKLPMVRNKTKSTIKGMLNDVRKRKKKESKKKRKDREEFYSSKKWMIARYKALERDNGICQCCGRTRHDGVKMHVDHIKPLSKFPELSLDLDNLQTLCSFCNIGKSNNFQTDWREKNTKQLDFKSFAKMDDIRFYSNSKWKKIKKLALLESDYSCIYCGNHQSDNLKLKVVHIKTRQENPELAFELSNLMVICERCSS